MPAEFEHNPAAVDIAVPAVWEIIGWSRTADDASLFRFGYGVISSYESIVNGLARNGVSLDRLSANDRVMFANVHVLTANKIGNDGDVPFAKAQLLVANWVALGGESSTRAREAVDAAWMIIDYFMSGH